MYHSNPDLKETVGVAHMHEINDLNRRNEFENSNSGLARALKQSVSLDSYQNMNSYNNNNNLNKNENCADNSLNIFNPPPLPGLFPDEKTLDKTFDADLKRDINVNSLILSYDPISYNDETNYYDKNPISNDLLLNTNANFTKMYINSVNMNPNNSNNKINMNKIFSSSSNQKFNSNNMLASSFTHYEQSMNFNSHKNNNLMADTSSSFGLKNSRLVDVLKAVDGDIIFGENSSKHFNDHNTGIKKGNNYKDKEKIYENIEYHTKRREKKPRKVSNKEHSNTKVNKTSQLDNDVPKTKKEKKTKGQHTSSNELEPFKLISDVLEKEKPLLVDSSIATKKKPLFKNERYNYLAPLKKMLKSKSKPSSEEIIKVAVLEEINFKQNKQQNHSEENNKNRKSSVVKNSLRKRRSNLNQKNETNTHKTKNKKKSEQDKNSNLKVKKCEKDEESTKRKSKNSIRLKHRDLRASKKSIKHKKSVRRAKKSDDSKQITNRNSNKIDFKSRLNLNLDQNAEFKINKYLNDMSNPNGFYLLENDVDIIDLTSNSSLQNSKSKNRLKNVQLSVSSGSIIYSDEENKSVFLNQIDVPNSIALRNDKKNQKTKSHTKLDKEAKKKIIKDAIEKAKNLKPPSMPFKAPPPLPPPQTSKNCSFSKIKIDKNMFIANHQRPLSPPLPPPPPPPCSNPPSIHDRIYGVHNDGIFDDENLDYIDYEPHKNRSYSKGINLRDNDLKYASFSMVY